MHACTFLFELGIDVAVKWIHAHVGISRNECADKIAMSGLSKPSIEFHIRYTLNDVMSHMTSVQNRQWQQSWAGSFYYIHPRITRYTVFLGTSRGDQRLVSRMRLGGASLNHPLFLLGIHDIELCSSGQLKPFSLI